MTGIDIDGGYAEYIIVPHHALARIPDGLDSVDAAPLLCAGVSTFNALRKSNARIGDVVAAVRIGGLGHLGIQFARAGGFETVAVSQGAHKRELAVDLGADHYIDTTVSSPAEILSELGGASAIITTAPSEEAIEATLPGLAVNGEIYPLGVPEEKVGIDVIDLIENQRSMHGHSSGTARESQAALEFSALRSITPMVEVFPLSEAETAYQRMKDQEVEFRTVLVPDA